jgi:BA14K-like protein
VIRKLTRIACAACVGATLTIVASSAIASPSGLQLSPTALTKATETLVNPAQYRGRSFSGQRRGGRFNGYRGESYGRGYGRDAVIGLGSLIIGGVLLSEVARSEHRRDNGDDWDRCAETYRSFEPNSGMYTGYDGIRRSCPYLN